MRTVFFISLLGLAAAAVPSQAGPLQAYDNTGSSTGGAGGNLNIGHEFTVSGSGITVTALGVYDDQGHTLLDSHDVTLFSISNVGTPASATPLVTTTIAAGGSSPSDFVYNQVTPTYLAPGTYGIIAYGLNSAGGDPYGDGGGLPNTTTVQDYRFDPFQFTSAGTPAFPQGGDSNVHSSTSFLYNNGNTTAVPEPASFLLMGLGGLGTFLAARRRAAASLR